MRLAELSAHRWSLPLHAPFSIATRTAYEAQNVLLSLTTDDNVVQGWGECAPVSYVTGETTDTVLDAITTVAPLFAGMPAERLQPLWETCARELPSAPAARAGLEMALLDVWARRWSLPLWQYFGGAETTLTTDITVPLVTPDAAAALADAAWREGFRHLKIKVGCDAGHEEDLARVEAILRVCPDALLRIDANQAFDVEGAVFFVAELIKMGAKIELLEQPVPKSDWKGLKELRGRVTVPIFADEAACSPSQVFHLLRHEAVDGVNVKLQKSGIAGALEIISLCKTAGVRLMLGCMLESEMGITAAAVLAGGTGSFDFLDLDSHRLLRPVPELRGGVDAQGSTLRLKGDTPGWGTSLDGDTGTKPG